MTSTPEPSSSARDWKPLLATYNVSDPIPVPEIGSKMRVKIAEGDSSVFEVTDVTPLEDGSGYRVALESLDTGR